MSSSLRILMVTPRYAPHVGGVERHVHEVARRLRARDCTVGVLTTDPTGGLPSNQDIDGVAVKRVRAYPRGRDYYFAPGVYRTIVAEHADWDVVHVQSYHTCVAPLAMLGAHRAGLPYVLTFHGGGHSSRVRLKLRPLQWRTLKPLMRGASRLVALAGFEIDRYSKVLGVPRGRFELIPNGIDVPAELPEVPVDGTLIASVGRLEKYKGHQRIIAALPAIIAQRPDARLWIAGEGPYETNLREQATALGVADRVDIRAIPAHERERMATALAGAALVVLLSEHETHPLAVLEAVALRRPALVAAAPGLKDLADRNLAVAIPLDSTADEVAAAVLEQLESPHEPAGTSLPTWDDCATSLHRLYEQVAAANGRA